jgi:hypothetical protein
MDRNWLILGFFALIVTDAEELQAYLPDYVGNEK